MRSRAAMAPKPMHPDDLMNLHTITSKTSYAKALTKILRALSAYPNSGVAARGSISYLHV